MCWITSIQIESYGQKMVTQQRLDKYDNIYTKSVYNRVMKIKQDALIEFMTVLNIRIFQKKEGGNKIILT